MTPGQPKSLGEPRVVALVDFGYQREEFILERDRVIRVEPRRSRLRSHRNAADIRGVIGWNVSDGVGDRLPQPLPLLPRPHLAFVEPLGQLNADAAPVAQGAAHIGRVAISGWVQSTTLRPANLGFAQRNVSNV